MNSAEWQWLKSTLELQTKTYGYDFDRLSENEAKQADYIFWNVFAAQQELAESAVEFSWKPWAKDDPFVNSERIIEEMVDVCHFVANILVALGVTDEEWALRYQQKQAKNRNRVASGNYSAKKGSLGEGSEVE